MKSPIRLELAQPSLAHGTSLQLDADTPSYFYSILKKPSNTAITKLRNETAHWRLGSLRVQSKHIKCVKQRPKTKSASEFTKCFDFDWIINFRCCEYFPQCSHDFMTMFSLIFLLVPPLSTIVSIIFIVRAALIISTCVGYLKRAGEAQKINLKVSPEEKTPQRRHKQKPNTFTWYVLPTSQERFARVSEYDSDSDSIWIWCFRGAFWSASWSSAVKRGAVTETEREPNRSEMPANLSLIQLLKYIELFGEVASCRAVEQTTSSVFGQWKCN